jgi:hypothetical protein
MTSMATKTGNLNEQHSLAFQAGGPERLILSVAALLLGIAYVFWGEYESYALRQ